MEVESRITEVTLYARGARVRRAATVALAGARIRITGLPVAVLDDTVRIEAEGGAVVTAVHVGVDAPAAGTAADEVAAEIRAARRRAALADAEVERLDAALAALAAAPLAASEPPAPRAEPPPAWSAIVDARRALVAVRVDRELALRDQAAAARRAAAAAHRALTAAQDRERRAGTARPARLHELRKHIDLQLQVEGTGSATLYLEYQVAAARWAPSYVARLDGERVVFEVRAAVAQATGEDWTAVRLRLSTAEPEQFGALPELSAQRIGRRQPEPVRAGFRAPPSGVAALYDDYLRAFPSGRGGDARIGAGATLVPPAEIWDEGSSRAKPAFALMAPGAPAGGAAPAPAPAQKTIVAGLMPPMAEEMSRATLGRSAPRGGVREMDQRSRMQAEAAVPAPLLAPPEAPPAPLPPPRLDYTHLRMAPPGSPERGTLVPVPDRLPSASMIAAASGPLWTLNALALPAGCSASWPHTYDYAFATDGAVDVRSDGVWHSIAVTARPTTAKLRHVAVPREQADVFRLASIANPLPGPLLPGPVDVYDRGKFLITSAVDHTPPDAEVEVGLGVDPAVKLARNTEFREETTGVLRGGLRLHHAIAIDVDNQSDRAIDLEVRERLPVGREGDDDVAVIAGRVEPAWERWAPEPEAPDEPRLRGGHRWRLAIPARTRRTLRAAYEVKIAGKLELVGGNRREP